MLFLLTVLLTKFDFKTIMNNILYGWAFCDDFTEIKWSLKGFKIRCLAEKQIIKNLMEERSTT